MEIAYVNAMLILRDSLFITFNDEFLYDKNSKDKQGPFNRIDTPCNMQEAKLNLTMNHIHIRCSDLDNALKFYTETLGGEFDGRSEAGGMPILRVKLGGATLSLSPPKEGLEVEPNSGKPRYGLYQLGFAVENIDQAYQELKAKGVVFKGEPKKGPELKVAFLAAPDGMEIELMEFC